MTLSRLFGVFAAAGAALFSGLAFAAPSPVLLEERFALPDGPLHETPGSAWKVAHGRPSIRVQGGRALIAGAAEGDSEGLLLRAWPGKTAAGGALELSFTLRVDVNPPFEESVQLPVQFASADGRKRRGRVAMRVLADGSCRIGVTSKSSAEVAWSAEEFSRFEDHAVVLAYDPATGRSLLWVDRRSLDAAPAAEAGSDDILSPGAVILQQAGKAGGPEIRLGELAVRALAPGATAAVASPAAAPAKASRPVAAAVTPPATGFHVFLLLGQSNMAGRGVVEEQDRKTDSRILAWRPAGDWTLAKEPLHDDKPAVAGVGPGFAFARALLPSLHDRDVIGLVPAAFGGTRIAWWQKDYDGAQRWPDGKTYYARAIAAGRSLPPGAKLEGILWIQGESDLGASLMDGGATYRAMLHALIRDLRADLGRPELPFVAATLKPWQPAEAETLNAIYKKLPDEVPHTAVIDTRAPDLAGRLHNKPDDTPHYDSASARLVGDQFAAVFRSIVADASAR